MNLAVMKPQHLNKTLEDLRQEHQLLHELAGECFRLGCRIPSMGILPQNPWMLNNRQVEELLIGFPHVRSHEERNAILNILDMRMSRRLGLLSWYVYQYFCEMPHVEKLIPIAGNYIANNYPDRPLAELYRDMQTVSGEDIQERFLAWLLLQKKPLITIIADNFLLLDAAFFKNLLKPFFISCSDYGYIHNKAILSEQLDKFDEDTFLAFVSNYLSKVSIDKLEDSVCLFIMKRLGQPHTSELSGEIWNTLGDHLRQKMGIWLLFYRMTLKLDDKNVIAFWKNYHPYIRGLVALDEVNGLAIDLGEYVAVNDTHASQSWFVMQRDTFLQLRTMLVDMIGNVTTKSLSDTMKALSAREVILEGMRGEITELTLYRTGFLFARDFLSELLEQ